MDSDERLISIYDKVAAIDVLLAVLVERLTDYPQIRERVTHLEMIVNQHHAQQELREANNTEVRTGVIAAAVTGFASMGLMILARALHIG